jgi:NADPH:quinone reductase-like Zn-dependent oxidoreductase
MKAIRLFKHGDPAVLQYIDCDMPDLGDDDVLVKVRATAINQWDLRYRSGKLPPNPLPGRPPWPLPFQLGRDAAGEVVETGRNVTKWRIGDRVVQMPHPACGHCAMCIRGLDNLCINTAYPGHQVFGGYAEYIARSQNAVLRIPDNIGFEAAAATLWAYTTPVNCATRRAPVGPGDTVLITGASGGIALACAQIAKLYGAKTIATTGKIERVAELKAHGYDHVLDYRDPQTPAAVRQLTQGLGVDAVWDCVGGSDFLDLAIACIRLGGTIAIFGTPVTQTGSDLKMQGTKLIFTELNLVGVRGAGRRDQQRCMEWLGEGKISPIIDRSFPLSEAASAHAYLESQQQIGKILLIPEHSA